MSKAFVSNVSGKVKVKDNDNEKSKGKGHLKSCENLELNITDIPFKVEDEITGEVKQRKNKKHARLQCLLLLWCN